MAERELSKKAGRELRRDWEGAKSELGGSWDRAEGELRENHKFLVL